MLSADVESVVFDTVFKAVKSAMELFNSSSWENRSWTKENKSGEPEIVTTADIAVERHLIRSLTGPFPDATIISEETHAHANLSEGRLAFIIDPIDGTSEFARGSPQFAVSVAAFEGKTPLCGVVGYPRLGYLLHACRGRGAHDRDRRLTATNGTPPDRPIRMGVSPREIHLPQVERINKFFNIAEIVTIPTLTGKAGAVALGDVDVAFYLADKGEAYLWDYAAIAVILEEAGYVMTDWNGNNVSDSLPKMIPGGWITGPRILVGKLIKLLEKTTQ